MSEPKKWKKINKSVKERPKVQEYKNWKELSPIPISLPMVGSIGTTGDWRSFRPVILEGCNKCGICFIFCPEGVISRQQDGSFSIDLTYCNETARNELINKITKVFDLSPGGIIEALDLRRPIYKRTAVYGHFGREEEGFSWEKTDKVDELAS